MTVKDQTKTKSDLIDAMRMFTDELKVVITDDEDVWPIDEINYMIDKSGEGVLLLKMGYSASSLAEESLTQP